MLPLDRGVSALLDDLEASGLLTSTLVLVLGDFGRTPRINANGGRDHFPKISSMLMAGAGVRRGSVLGSTDANGEEIIEGSLTMPDLVATLAQLVGLVPDEVHMTPAGRPISTVDPAGSPGAELLA